MSQGQGKFLSDEDVRTFINDSLNLKLDHNAFLKPSPDIVCELYSRFLDITLVNWRKPEPTIKVQMNSWLRVLFEPYNVGIEFNLRDLTAPTRKRTMAFLNIIIHIRLQIDECLEEQQGRVSEWHHNNAAIETINEEIEQKKLLRDELALKKGSIKSSGEIHEIKTKQQVIFEQKNQLCEKLGDEGAIAKQRAKESAETVQKGQARIEVLKQDLYKQKDLLKKFEDGLDLEPQRDKLKQRLIEITSQITIVEGKIQVLRMKVREAMQLITSLNSSNKKSCEVSESIKNPCRKFNSEKSMLEDEAKRLEAELAGLEVEQSDLLRQLRDSEVTLDKVGASYKIKQENVRTKISEKQSMRSKRESDYNAEWELFEKDLTDIKNQHEKYRTDYNNKSEEYKVQLEKITRLFDAQTKKYQEMTITEQKAIEHRLQHAAILERFVGKPKENEMPVNRTYIKEDKAHTSVQ